MWLKCIKHFGNFKPGELVEVPDSAIFDPRHFMNGGRAYEAARLCPLPEKPSIPAHKRGNKIRLAGAYRRAV